MNSDLAVCSILVVGVGAYDDPAVKCCVLRRILANSQHCMRGVEGAAPYNAPK